MAAALVGSPPSSTGSQSFWSSEYGSMSASITSRAPQRYTGPWVLNIVGLAQSLVLGMRVGDRYISGQAEEIIHSYLSTGRPPPPPLPQLAHCADSGRSIDNPSLVTSDGWAFESGWRCRLRRGAATRNPSLTLGQSWGWMASKPLNSGLLLLSRADSD